MVQEYWCHLFRQNEITVRDKAWGRVLDDDDLTTRILQAFPNRWESRIFRQIGRMRSRYNRGALTNGCRPIVQSRRYRRLDKEVWLCTKRGRLLQKLGTASLDLTVFDDKGKTDEKEDEG